MHPTGLGTKNDCTGEDQQQFTRPTEIMEIKESQGKIRLWLFNDEITEICTNPRVVRQIMVVSPAGTETKNDCTGEGQQ
jgi:hypothetical protein